MGQRCPCNPASPRVLIQGMQHLTSHPPVDSLRWPGCGEHEQAAGPDGTVNLVADKGVRGVLVRMGWLWCRGQAAAGASPVTWFQVVNRVVISCRYWVAVSRWRRGRKCGDIPLNADKNRWAPPAEWNRFIARSRCLVGWWEFSARLFRYFDRRCSTPRTSRRWATP